MTTAAVLRAIVTVDGAEKGAGQLGMFGAKVESVAASAGGGLTKMGAAGALAFAALGAGAVAGMAKAVSATEEFGAHVLALHRIIGGSVGDASRLEVVFEHFGVSSDKAARAMSLLEKNIVNGGKAVKDYGLSLTDANGKTLTGTQILEEAAQKYQSLGSAAEKTAFLLNVFGRSGRDMAVVMQGGAKSIEQVAAEAQKYGLVLSGSNLEAIHKYALAQHDLGLASTGLKVSIGQALIPILTKFDQILTTGVEILNKVPGPIKTVALGAVALTGAIVAAGIAVGIFRAALGNLGISLGMTVAAETAATASTEALAVAEGQAAVETTGFAGTLGALGPLGIAASAALAGMTVDTIAQTKAAEEAAKGHTFLGGAISFLGRLADGIPGVFRSINAVISDSAGFANDAGKAFNGMSISAANGAALAARALDGLGPHVQGVDKFMGMSLKAFQDWRVGTRAAANSVEGALGDLANKAHVSAGDIVKSFDKQIKVMGNYQRNWEVLLARGLPQDMAMQLQAMGTKGAGIVAALAHANQAQFNKIIGDWKRARGEAAVTTGAIKGIGAAAQDVAGTYYLNFVYQIKGQKPYNYGVKATGGMVEMAAGGTPPVLELTRPAMIAPGVVAGEGGREFVMPANQRGEQWIVNAVLKGLSQGFAEWGGGSSGPGDVYLDSHKVGAVFARADALRGVRT